MAIWWMTEAVSLAVTSLLPLAVLPLAGAVPAKRVAPAYFDDTVALFLGGFCVALALERTGLHRRIALGVLRVFGTRPRGMVLGFLAASALLSMWVSNTATALMLIPVAATAVAAVVPADPARRGPSERAFATACVLAVAYGASLGGMGTLVGTPPNMILKGVYDDLVAGKGGAPLTFGAWMGLGVPCVLVLVPLAWLLLTRVTVRVPARLPSATEGGNPPLSLQVPGTWSGAELAVALVFLATALAWITHQRLEIGGWVVPLTGWDEALRFGGAKTFLTDATIAVTASLLLFVLPMGRGDPRRILEWEYVQPRLPWAALLLFGGGFALADGFQASGLDRYLQAAFAGLQGMPPFLLVIVVVAGITAISEFASNTATAAALLPVLAAVAVAAGIDPAILLFAGTLGASCGYALPVATPPNTIAYGTGHVTAREMIRAGLLLDVVAILVVTIAVLLIGPSVLP
jgi:sodium-dependent dicarboxylate transporter 2/3/5